MAKKTDDKSSTKKDDEDLDREDAADEDEDEEEDEADEEEDEEEDDEDEEEVDRNAVAAKAAKADARHRHAHDDDDDDDDAVAPAEEDPSWWAPHAVLGVLVVVGILGFFGVFNKALGFIAAKPAGGTTETATATQPANKPATPQQPTQLQPPQPGQQQPQPPREMFGAKHLLVMYKGSRRAPPNIERSKEEAKARADEAAKKAKDSKNKFEDLVKEYSDEPGAGARGGDLGRFPKGAMVPEFQTALEKLKVNEVSDVVESPFGYHVILRTQ